MNQLDIETKTALEIRTDELCSNLKFDVMRELALLKASHIILKSFFGRKMPPEMIMNYAIHLSKYEE